MIPKSAFRMLGKRKGIRPKEILRSHIYAFFMDFLTNAIGSLVEACFEEMFR